MYRVTKEIPFCYGHRLLNYNGKCKNLHGHNGVAEITLETEQLDQSGFVVDFSDIKRIVATWIDENFDHRLLLHKDDPVVDYLHSQGEPIKVLDVNPSAENIARLIFEFVASQNLPVTQVKLWETPSCFALYRPSVDAPGHSAAGRSADKNRQTTTYSAK